MTFGSFSWGRERRAAEWDFKFMDTMSDIVFPEEK
jgi:hypothetical protein